ncbi:MAG: NAD(P)/FAD-dependent oxidoreductase, partial [Candidatus Tenebribacter mawsonii]|nr:NAD(P)/FAD-dependent oxidoreductase [Candidatus Tenebribacter mawsonii]
HPFIIGAGPAGLFAALSLVEKGFKPYIFDRGETILHRAKKVNDFWKNGNLDENSNVQFGEGGAGTFSDGKLTSRTNDFYTTKIIDYLIKFGADTTIKYDALPHLGTDGLRNIVIDLREFLIAKGCKFFWNSKLENIEIKNNKVSEVTINEEKYLPEILVLAIGNSARDTFTMFKNKISMENKSFAVGFRIEHSQGFINNYFYGEKTDFSLTGPATYRLTAKYKEKGIYSFCMCPGGYIVAGSSQQNGLVLNGMSYKDRSNKFANSAIVATVNKSDFDEDILAGMKFQQQIEQECFRNDMPYLAPSQNALDFINKSTSNKLTQTSFLPGIFHKDLSNIFSNSVTDALKFGLMKFEKRIPGFLENGLLLAPETRTSSPVRLIRERDTFQANGISNLFPIGEGSGYAGGIISSATDGYKCCKQFIQ